jgi:hypothetical protein
MRGPASGAMTNRAAAGTLDQPVAEPPREGEARFMPWPKLAVVGNDGDHRLGANAMN